MRSCRPPPRRRPFTSSAHRARLLAHARPGCGSCRPLSGFSRVVSATVALWACSGLSVLHGLASGLFWPCPGSFSPILVSGQSLARRLATWVALSSRLFCLVGLLACQRRRMPSGRPRLALLSASRLVAVFIEFGSSVESILPLYAVPGRLPLALGLPAVPPDDRRLRPRVLMVLRCPPRRPAATPRGSVRCR